MQVPAWRPCSQPWDKVSRGTSLPNPSTRPWSYPHEAEKTRDIIRCFGVTILLKKIAFFVFFRQDGVHSVGRCCWGSSLLPVVSLPRLYTSEYFLRAGFVLYEYVLSTFGESLVIPKRYKLV